MMDTLRSLVQPITHNLPAPVRDLGVSIIGEHCYESLLLDVNVEDTVCIKLGISKALGIGIVAASSIVKLPQIIKLVSSRSAAGISFLSYLLETSSFLISLVYNVRNGFPFSTYGETALLIAQNVVITSLILHFVAPPGSGAAFVAVMAAAAYALYSPTILDMEALSYFQVGAGVLSIASKVPQILAIWQEGGTGQLSAFAVFNYLAGSLSRIFTTLQEVDDKLILYGYVAGFVLNAVLAAQMIYYWNTPSKKALGKMPAPMAEPADSSATATGASPKPRGPSTRRRG